MSALELLERARALLARESRWTQKALARDEAGQPVQACSDDAVSWCLLGALEHEREEHDISQPDNSSALRQLFAASLSTSDFVSPFVGEDIAARIIHLELFNDSGSHRDILDVLGSAVLAASGADRNE